MGFLVQDNNYLRAFNTVSIFKFLATIYDFRFWNLALREFEF
jgi:hypothetical protein